MALRLFRKKSMTEKKILEKIGAKKSQDKKVVAGGSWISTSGGCYNIKYKKYGRVMELSELHLKNYMVGSPAELEILIEKAMYESKKMGCDIIVIKSWLFAKHPKLKEFGFKEIREGSEKECLEIIKKKNIDENKLLKSDTKAWYPTYYLELDENL